MRAWLVPQVASDRHWLGVLRQYLVFAALAHLVWEVAQLPLYTIWLTGTVGELAFAVLHCTGGDLLIALGAMMLALVLFGNHGWPRAGAGRVLAAAILFGVGYTIFSEWLNITVRGAWAYRDLMPVLPGTGTGLGPFLQWIVIPLAAWSWAIGRWPWRAKSKEAPHG
jgi:hypothetical protein